MSKPKKSKKATIRNKKDEVNAGSYFQLANEDKQFNDACILAEVEPTARQYKKFRGCWGGVGGVVKRSGATYSALQAAS